MAIQVEAIKEERAEIDALYDAHQREEFSEPRTTELVARLYDLNNHALTAVLEGASPVLVAEAATAGALPDLGFGIELTAKERYEVREAIEGGVQRSLQTLYATGSIEEGSTEAYEVAGAEVTDWIVLCAELGWATEPTTGCTLRSTPALRRLLPPAIGYVRERLAGTDPVHREERETQLRILESIPSTIGRKAPKEIGDDDG